MNVSPHHQRPAKYPWPGVASRLAAVIGLVVILVIAFLLITGSFSPDNDGGGSEATRPTAAYRI